MFNVIHEINWITVLLATIVNSIVGGFWFTVIWGKAYFSALGKDRGKSEKQDLTFIGIYYRVLMLKLNLSLCENHLPITFRHA